MLRLRSKTMISRSKASQESSRLLKLRESNSNTNLSRPMFRGLANFSYSSPTWTTRAKRLKTIWHRSWNSSSQCLLLVRSRPVSFNRDSSFSKTTLSNPRSKSWPIICRPRSKIATKWLRMPTNKSKRFKNKSKKSTQLSKRDRKLLTTRLLNLMSLDKRRSLLTNRFNSKKVKLLTWRDTLKGMTPI